MKKLTPEEMIPFKTSLLKLRDRLRGDVETITHSALNKDHTDASMDGTSMPIHMADAGSDNFEQELSLAMMMSENEMLECVEEALTRIADGTFGDCEECGGRITKTRLSAIPYAALCLKCASEEEEKLHAAH